MSNKIFCEFCREPHKNLNDTINMGTNNYSLTLDGDHLKLWERQYCYRGCYRINYCPICGRKLKH